MPVGAAAHGSHSVAHRLEPRLCFHPPPFARPSPLPQVYVQDPVGAGVIVRPWKRLLGFARLPGVAPGAQATAAVSVLADDLAYYGDDLTLQARAVVLRLPLAAGLLRSYMSPLPSSLQVHAGTYTVSAGLSSLDDEAYTAPFVVPVSYAPPSPWA